MPRQCRQKRNKVQQTVFGNEQFIVLQITIGLLVPVSILRHFLYQISCDGYLSDGIFNSHVQNRFEELYSLFTCALLGTSS